MGVQIQGNMGTSVFILEEKKRLAGTLEGNGIIMRCVVSPESKKRGMYVIYIVKTK